MPTEKAQQAWSVAIRGERGSYNHPGVDAVEDVECSNPG